jgi:thymidylate kinase
MLQNIIIEGLDRLGKSTLVSGIEERLGCFTKLHFGKPLILEHYKLAVGEPYAKEAYQRESFEQMFRVLDSEARMILDRGHLGEAVYSKRYRGYNGDYVFDLENVKHVNALTNTLLVLLVNHDKELERKLVDDGQSFDWQKRDEEQQDFIAAFNRSRIQHKLMVSVGAHGEFADKDWIADSVVKSYIHGA